MTIHISTPANVEADRYVRGTRAVLEAVRCGRLALAGAPGGQAWTSEQQALLFDSLETGWPVGQLVSWTPPRREGSAPRRTVLLDGHRRVQTLTQLLPETHPRHGMSHGLLRDLSTRPPRYLPADQVLPERRYLPVRAMLHTTALLAAIKSLNLTESDPGYDVAMNASSGIHRAVFDFIHIRQPDPSRVAELCRRLIPARVDPATLTQLTSDGG